MIVDLDSGPHPKAKIKAIDFDKGLADFVWLDADGNPSTVYSGVCVTPVGGMSLSVDQKAKLATAIKAESKPKD